LNLGGIANISFDSNGERYAYDICACNIVLNKYALLLGFPYDEGGRLAATGKVDAGLFRLLNALPFYKKDFPKSLGRENIEKEFLPVLENSSLTPKDVLATFCEHIAFQISAGIQKAGNKGKVLVTGGGALNDFLVGRLKHSSSNEIVIPEKKIVEFKEAIVFAFLGILRMRNEVNCLKGVTGSSRDNCGGAIYEP